MFLPYGTDTPIYHWPFATLGLIVFNIGAFVISLSVPDWDPYMLSHGEGLHPIQWVTSFMMHADVFHLLGNMVFLWVFGIVVEGKVGPTKFVALYIGMGIVQNIFEQWLFLGMPVGPSLGASGILYAMLVLAMFWAPGDNILCFLFLLFTPIPFTIPIIVFCFLYLMMDFGSAMFSGFEMSTPLLHIIGAAVGFIPAIVMLRWHMVESDNEDVLSRIRELRGKEHPEKKLSRREKQESEEERIGQQRVVGDKTALVIRSLDTHLSVGNITAATRLMVDYHRRGGRIDWTESQLMTLIKLSQSKNEWDQTIEFTGQYLKRFSINATRLRINMAKIYVLEKVFPRRALQTLEEVDINELSEPQRKAFLQIKAHANKLIDEGALEPGEG